MSRKEEINFNIYALILPMNSWNVAFLLNSKIIYQHHRQSLIWLLLAQGHKQDFSKELTKDLVLKVKHFLSVITRTCQSTQREYLLIFWAYLPMRLLIIFLNSWMDMIFIMIFLTQVLLFLCLNHPTRYFFDILQQIFSMYSLFPVQFCKMPRLDFMSLALFPFVIVFCSHSQGYGNSGKQRKSCRSSKNLLTNLLQLGLSKFLDLLTFLRNYRLLFHATWSLH
jgi:hypothetical protein